MATFKTESERAVWTRLPLELHTWDQLTFLWANLSDQPYPHKIPTDWPTQEEIRDGANLATLRNVFESVDDWEQQPRRRLIHSLGVVARFRLDISPQSSWSGLLRAASSALGIMRYSVVNGRANRIPPIPGVGLKFPVFRGRSINLHLSTGYFGGLEIENLLDQRPAAPMATRVPDPQGQEYPAPYDQRAANGMIARFRNTLVSLQGRDHQGALGIPLGHAATRTSLGGREREPRIPKQLQILHDEDVATIYRREAGSLRSRLLSGFGPGPTSGTERPWGTVLALGDKGWSKIGRIALVGGFVASFAADNHLFFAHATDRSST